MCCCAQELGEGEGPGRRPGCPADSAGTTTDGSPPARRVSSRSPETLDENRNPCYAPAGESLHCAGGGPMDGLDRQIVELLRANGRRSNVEIARTLGVSEGTVRKRVDRLIAEGGLAIRALANPAAAGYGVRALLFLNVALRRVRRRGRRALSRIPGGRRRPLPLRRARPPRRGGRAPGRRPLRSPPRAPGASRGSSRPVRASSPARSRSATSGPRPSRPALRSDRR